MNAVYHKELKSFFTNMMGCLFVAFVLLMAGIFTVAANFGSLYPNFEYAVFNTTLIYPFLVPILTMRSLAEEKRSRTEQLLFSAPVRVTDIVLGKYFAMLTILFIPVAIMCVFPFILNMYGNVNFAAAYSAVLAFFLLGAALIAIGMFISSLTENPIIAAAASLAVMLLLYFMKGIISLMSDSALISLLIFIVFALLIAFLLYALTRNKTVAVLAGFVLVIGLGLLYSMYPDGLSAAFSAILSALAPFTRMDNFYYGLLDGPALIYYVSCAALFCFFTIQSIEKRRWS